jgi:two-component system, NtrC family, response regulator HydG
MSQRVFIVDDDRDHAESIADILELQGFEVEIAYSGEEAIERFAKGDFDVTLMDVQLPGMNGVETFFHFRATRPDAKVIMMTGFSVEQLIQQAVDGGAAGVLFKPFSINDLLHTLESAKPHGLVLIADDDPSFSDSISEVLAAAGYRVEIARTGQEAVDKATQASIDCLILDLRLPILSGIEVFMKLKQLGRVVPTILATGFVGEGQAALQRVAADTLLIKPFDPVLLLDAVRAALDLRRDSNAA